LKAVVYSKYGGPEVLEVKEIEKPSPKDNEVLVKLFAASVNDWDWGLLNPETFLEKLMVGFGKPKHPILGSDIAGRIEAVGKDVQKFRVGDEVYGDLSGQWGGFAEYVCTTENKLWLKPPAMSFEDAASIPQAAMLAVQGLRDKGQVRPGQKLLINGAGGGVGTFGIQIVRPDGVEVTAVDSAEKLDMLRTLGANHVIDYRKEDFTNNGQTYDLVLDTKTNRPIFRYLRALKPNGVYVTVGGSLGRLFQAFILSPLIALFTKKRVRIVMLKPNKDLPYMNELFEAGKLKPVIDGPYKLEDTAEAFRLFEKAAHKGKIVISINTHQ